MKNSEKKASKLRKQIEAGMALLQDEMDYSQANILDKMKTLKIETSPSSLSNILTGKRVGNTTLKKVSQGIQRIVESELAYVFDEASETFKRLEANVDFTPEVIPEFDARRPDQNKAVLFHSDGRLPLHYKVSFMTSAKKEVVEVGARLRTFVDYFYSRNEKEFAEPIKQLLKAGVNLKLYIVNPDCNESLIYFKDRSNAVEGSEESVELVKKVLERLTKIAVSLNALNFTGRVEIYTYRHLPYNHFLLIDGGTRNGKMMVSNYLYGIKRADCPVIEVSKQSDHDLFNRYFLSFRSFIKGAKKLELPAE